MRLSRKKLVGATTALAVAALTGLAWTLDDRDVTPVAGAVAGVVPLPAAAATAAPSAAPTEAAAPTPAPTPTAAPGAEPLAPGEEPPQFVVVSFDGGGNLESWAHWLDVARRSDATMTFFLTGLYMLPQSKADLYDPPHRPRGSSDVGFSNNEDIRARMEFVRQAYLAGNEIGTHYNGHFCGLTGVQSWSAADWRSELDQFFRFLADWRTNADAPDAEPMPFGSDAIVGQRTPCLEGSRKALWPVLAERGFRYDTNEVGELRWPTRMSNGMWEIPLQSLRLAGSGRHVLSMDWNFYDAQSGGRPAPAGHLDALRQQALQTYRNAYQALYDGNRAPLVLGNHFSPFNKGIYNDALSEFVLETCRRPQTRCVSFEQLVDWMEAQTPETLARLQGRPVQPMAKTG